MATRSGLQTTLFTRPERGLHHRRRAHHLRVAIIINIMRGLVSEGVAL